MGYFNWFIAGIPTAIITGPLFTRYRPKKIFGEAPILDGNVMQHTTYPAVRLILCIMGILMFLIVSNTVLNSVLMEDYAISVSVKSWLQMIGFPYTGLILANLIAWYVFGIKRGHTKETMLKLTTNSM